MSGAFDAADRFLVDATPRYTKTYAKALSDLFVFKVRNNAAAAQDALRAFANVQRETMAVAEIYGARLVLRRAARELRRRASSSENLRSGRAMVRFANQAILPNVTLDEALEDMIERTPVTLRRAAERTAQRIAQLYSEDRVIAFAKSAEATVTKEAQAFILRALRDGTPSGDAGRALAMSVNAIREKSEAWSQGYANTVFRTNANTAITAGRFRQAQDDDIKQVTPVFRFDAVGDADTRDNHDAADGVILRVDNPAWNRLAPPLGYNCRCQVSLVSIFELEDMGRVDRFGNIRESTVPFAAKPDDGFRYGGRPDLFIVDGGAT